MITRIDFSTERIKPILEKRCRSKKVDYRMTDKEYTTERNCGILIMMK